MVPSKKITSLFGKTLEKSYPTQDEMEALPKLPNGAPDTSKLPRETVGNMVLCLLSNYPIQGKEDSFKIYSIAQLVAAAEEGEVVELKPKLKDLLLKVLDWGTIAEKEVEGKPVRTGVYFSWAIQQILDELGVTHEEI